MLILIKTSCLTKLLLLRKNYKYFIGYLDDDYKMKPLHIILPKTSAYIKSYDGETKWMYILIDDAELLEKCKGIWNKVSNSIKKELDCEPIYNKTFLKIKENLTAMNLQIFKIKKCLRQDLIIFDLFFKKDKSYYYPQVFLKECKYIYYWWVFLMTPMKNNFSLINAQTSFTNAL